MLDNPERLYFVLALVTVLTCMGLSGLLFLAECMWKPEHAYDILLRLRRLAVGAASKAQWSSK